MSRPGACTGYTGGYGTELRSSPSAGTPGTARTPAHGGPFHGRGRCFAATLGAVITRLQARGLIRRESDPGDRRRKLLWLTSEGEVLARQLIAPARRVQERLMAPLPPEEQVLLQQLLARLVFSEEG